MIWRTPLFRLALGGALLLLLALVFLSTSPVPPQPEPQTSSREWDEAAEEVRAVASHIRRLESRILDQGEQIRALREAQDRLEHRFEQRDHHQSPPEAETSKSALPPTSSSPVAESNFDLSTLRHEDVIPTFLETSLASPAFRWVDPIRSPNPLPLGPATPSALQATTSGEVRFVIPPAVLEGVALTALVGRIPRSGSVQDPWPFVAVSRADNFTANGVTLPHLRGILWRGVVHGDATLSCASASIRSLVYVFEDGVFHVADAGGQDGFGYLADKAGNPCLNGELVSSQASDLWRNLAAGLISGTGGAFAENQVTRQVSQGGETANVRDGAAFDFLLGTTTQSAAQAYADYLARYANDAWDAIFVEAGREVDIHLTQAIPIHHVPHQNLHDSFSLATVAPNGGLD